MATTAARTPQSNPEPIAATPAPRAKRRRSAAKNAPAQHLREAGAIAGLGLAVFFAAALATYRVAYEPGAPGANLCGWVGHALAGAAIVLLGKTVYIPLAFGFVWSIVLFLRGRIEAPLVKALGVATLTIAFAILLEHREPFGAVPGDARGGWLGTALTPYVAHGFGALGTYLVLFVLASLAFTIATDYAFVPLVREGIAAARRAGRELRESAVAVRDGAVAIRTVGLGERLSAWLAALRREAPAPEAAAPPDLFVPAEPVAEAEPPELGALVPFSTAAPEAAAAKEPAADAADRGARKKAKDEAQPKLPFPAPAYRLPEAKLLDDAKKVKVGELTDEARGMAQKIEDVMRSFEVEVRVVGVSRGPAVTLFELEMGEGVTVNTLTARRHDLAIRLKSGGVRFVYPIPGRSTVGVEVPNQKREFVRLRELLDELPAAKAKGAIPLYLGRDVMNRAVVEDLSEMPHLLIAGQTGSGKSACLNAILCSVLLARDPDEVKVILVDPKHVEFSKYEGIPHLMCPIVTVARKVPIVLDWVIAEMEARYEFLAKAGVRKISDFNAIPKKELKERFGEEFDAENTPLRLPYLVVVVDEMNDLMIQAKKDMEDRITRIAQKSRAVGIHLILATQRPSVNVITGTIKANLPTRIAFQTAQGNDSRVILDQIGAEDLLGKGDFLYKPPGTDKFVRAQGTWVGDEEIERLVKHAKSLAEPRYDIRLIQIKESDDSEGEGEAPQEATFEGGWKDPLFERAVLETLESNRAAASHLQRAFAIGYNRATRILDGMAALGIVSNYEGSKVRRILITKEEWGARRAELLAGPRRAADPA